MDNNVWGLGAAELAPDAAIDAAALRQRQIKAEQDAQALKAILDKEKVVEQKETEKGFMDDWF